MSLIHDVFELSKPYHQHPTCIRRTDAVRTWSPVRLSGRATLRWPRQCDALRLEHGSFVGRAVDSAVNDTLMYVVLVVSVIAVSDTESCGNSD